MSNEPGAFAAVTAGESVRGDAFVFPLRIPLAEARFEAMELLISLGGMRRGECRLALIPIFADLLADIELAIFGAFALARSSATAAEVETVFSSPSLASAVGFGEAPFGCFNRAASCAWCASRRRRVRAASTFFVWDAALANSPAAWVCSSRATVGLLDAVAALARSACS